MSLAVYKKKRDFKNTSEPKGKERKSKSGLIFVVQQHAASHLHYDFRLEMEGVLKSWAVPKGPSLNPNDKRLAMMVEDHPYDYKDFEGTIPEGNYGAGNVIVWDNGTYYAVGGAEDDPQEDQLLAGLKKGKISFILEGKKLKGEFALVKMRGRQENAWLLIKKEDKYATDEDVLKKNRSVKTKRTLNSLGVNRPVRSTVKRTIGRKEKPAASAVAEPLNAPAKKGKKLERIQPMLAEIADQAFDNPDWIFEYKYDGYRAVANVQDGVVDLYSRNLNSFNEAYPAIAKELRKLKYTAILDGEIVAENKEGRSEFQLLQNTGNTPVKLKYYVFDLLHLNGYDLLEVPLRNRKELLRMLLARTKMKNIVYSEHVAANGIDFFQKATVKKFEGIIAKNAKSPYRAGRRTKDWLKIKIHQQQEVVIAGMTEPKGSRSHFGSLILGVQEGKEWKYVGNCGTGFDEATLEMLYNKAKPYFTDHSPFHEKVPNSGKIQWIRPHIVCEVKFSEWTGDSRMRHPVYLGLRADKKANEVKKEIPTVSGEAQEADTEETPSDMKPGNKSTRKNEHEQKNRSKKNDEETEKEYDLRVGNVTLRLTNQDKLYWPEEKISKGELINYYDDIAEFILPYLKDRPQSMHRFPNGIHAQSFYQKDVDKEKIPGWLKTANIYSESNKEYIDYLVCNDKATLLYMANLGCIEINPWNSRVGKEEYPDWLVIDLDPEEIPFCEVVNTAIAVKKTLDEIEVNCYCKTSGASGLHIFVPLGAKYDYNAARTFAELIATLVHQRVPETTSILRSPSKRKKKVYLDYLQNSRGQTLAAPYSVRPRPGATVSAPLEWKELTPKLDPSQFTLHNMRKRLDKIGDIWGPVIGKGENIQQALKRLHELQEEEDSK